MGHEVFLSYSTKDKTAAQAVCAALERRGIGVWMAPRDIPPGSSYAASIVEAIDSARVLVLVFSAAANDSQDTEREVQRADTKRLKIVPFRIEDVAPKASLAYFLSSREGLDAFTPPIEARYDELSEAVRRLASQVGSPRPSPAPPGPGGHEFFVSYSRDDKDFVLRLANDLRAAGVRLWIDQLDIVPGDRWDRAIEKALAAASGLLVVLSPDSAQSQNVMDEVALAFDEQKRIVPILIKPCDISFRLRRLQHVDFTTGYKARLADLIGALKSQSGADAPAPIPSAGVKPPAPASPRRSLRLPAALAVIVGLLVASGVVAWQWPRPAPVPDPAAPAPVQSDDKPKPPSDRPAPSAPSPADSGDFSIIFGTEVDPKSAMTEINAARQFPNSPPPVLNRKNRQWMSIVSFASADARDQQLKVFRAKFPRADAKPLKLSSLCPNSRLISAETADMAEQRDCGS